MSPQRSTPSRPQVIVLILAAGIAMVAYGGFLAAAVYTAGLKWGPAGVFGALGVGALVAAFALLGFALFKARRNAA